MYLLTYFLIKCRERELQGVTKVKKRPPLRRGRVSPCLPVPENIPKPPYVGANILPEISSKHQIHDSEGIASMRAACELAARVLNYAGTLVRVRFSPFSVLCVSFTGYYPLLHLRVHLHYLYNYTLKNWDLLTLISIWPEIFVF